MAAERRNAEAAFFANRLRVSRSIRNYFDGLAENKNDADKIEAIEKGFRALVAFDYSIPKLLVDMEALVNFHCTSLGLDGVEYSFMAQALDNCFSHRWIKALDEYGVPIPLGRKLTFLVEDSYTLDDAVGVVKVFFATSDAEQQFTTFERNLVYSALA